MKDKLFLKRKHIQWNEVRRELGDYFVDQLFYCKLGQLQCSKRKVSFNRVSYWALLTVYGKAKMDSFRATGSYEVFTFHIGVL